MRLLVQVVELADLHSANKTQLILREAFTRGHLKRIQTAEAVTPSTEHWLCGRWDASGAACYQAPSHPSGFPPSDLHTFRPGWSNGGKM